MLRICKAVSAPGRPSCWRVFTPAILPTRAPPAVTAEERAISSDLIEETAPVNVAFFCDIPNPVITTSSRTCVSFCKVTVISLASPTVTFCV